MSAGRIASRYAKSLLDLAIEQNKLDEVYEQVSGISRSIAGSGELDNLLKSPIVSSDKKLACLNKLFGGKVNNLVQKFIEIIVGKRREAYLGEIASSFVSQYNAKKGVGEAVLITASEVSDQLLQKIKGFVMANAAGINTVQLTTQIDPSILGGFILQFNDKQYDSSIASKLKNISKNFSDNKHKK